MGNIMNMYWYKIIGPCFLFFTLCRLKSCLRFIFFYAYVKNIYNSHLLEKKKCADDDIGHWHLVKEIAVRSLYYLIAKWWTFAACKFLKIIELELGDQHLNLRITVLCHFCIFFVLRWFGHPILLFQNHFPSEIYHIFPSIHFFLVRFTLNST